MSFDPVQVAALLDEFRQDRTIVSPLPADIAPRTEEEGAVAQFALAQRLGAVPPGGFKIGATGKRMQQYLGLDHPAAGFMLVGDLYDAAAEVAFAECIRPGVECELAVRLAHDLPAGPCTAEQAAAAVGELIAAIELVENRYDDIATLGTPTLIADQVYHVAAVQGAAYADWRSLDLPTLRGRMSVDGVVRDEGVGAELLGHPMNGLAWLAGSSVAAAFGGLKAGQVVMLGSVTPPIWLDGPSEVMVEFAPLPPVRLRLT